jgi:TonB family protein
VWLSWREPAEIAAAEAAPTALRRSEKPSGHPAPHVLPLSPEPGVGGRESDRLRTKNVLQNAAEIGPATGGPRPSSSATDLSEPNAVENSALRSAPPGSASEPPPTVEVTASTIPDELAGLSSAPAALPAFGASVSTGVIEGNLIHRVEPTYPQQARIQKLVGAVVLDATVAEDGSVREVKVVNGSPLLAAAATAAVQQWRYRPSQLNGKPIAVEKQITIVFKLP